MKMFSTVILAAFIATGFNFPVNAATKKDDAATARKAECTKDAKEKYSAVHFMKRRAYIQNCMKRTKA